MSEYASHRMAMDVPACEWEELPEKQTQVTNTRTGKAGIVTDTHAACSEVCVLWEGAMWGEWGPVSEVTW